MRVQDEKTKGFNLLELIIVVVIIGVISAVGYPNFSEWRKDRLVRSDVIKIRSLIEGINSQVQRGQYAFVQAHIEEGQLINGEDGLIVTSKGMKSNTLGALLNNDRRLRYNYIISSGAEIFTSASEYLFWTVL